MKDMKFPFSDAPNTACFTCRHVLEENRPIRYVSHDEDGYWQFLCGGNHTEEDARVVSLVSVWEMDESVGELAGLDYGESAEAADPADGWVIAWKGGKICIKNNKILRKTTWRSGWQTRMNWGGAGQDRVRGDGGKNPRLLDGAGGKIHTAVSGDFLPHDRRR